MSRPLQLGSNENRDSYNFLVILNDLEQTLSVLNLESTDGSVSGTGYIDASGNSTNNDIKYFVTKKGITTGYQNLNFDYICQFSSVNSYTLSSSVFDSNLYDLSFLPKTIKDIYDLNSGITTNETITFDSPNIPSIPTTIVKIPGDCVTNCEIINDDLSWIKELECASVKNWRILVEINPNDLSMSIKFDFNLYKKTILNCRQSLENSVNYDVKTKYKNSRTYNYIAEQLKSDGPFTIDGCSEDLDTAKISSNLIGKFDVFYITEGVNDGSIDPKFREVPDMYDMESRFTNDTIGVGISQMVSRGTKTLLEYGKYVKCNKGMEIKEYFFQGSIRISVDLDDIISNIKYSGGFDSFEPYDKTGKYKGGFRPPTIPKFTSSQSVRDKYGSRTFDSKALKGIEQVLKNIAKEVDRFCENPPCNMYDRYKYVKHLLDAKLVKDNGRGLNGILRALINQLFKDMEDLVDFKECPCPEQ